MGFIENKEDLKIKELVALRGHYFSAVLLISSGIAGLFFADIMAWKLITFCAMGIYLDMVFISNFFNTNDEIKDILMRMK